MNILITGGYGFVGTSLLPLLSGHDVTVLDNLMSRPHVPMLRKKFPAAKLVVGDIRDTRLVKSLTTSADMVIHLAGIVGYPACDIDKQFSYDVNVLGTKNLVQNLSADQRLIFISSTSAYGDKPGIVVTEDTPLAPLTSYGVHKKVGEALVLMSKARSTILRPATAFGVSEQIRIDLLPNTLAYEALTRESITLYQPESVRPFIHVRDFACGIAHFVRNDIQGVFNLGNPDLTMTKLELAQYFAELTDCDITPDTTSVDPDKRNYLVSFDKLAATGFTAGYSFLTGFEEIRRNLKKIQKNYVKYTTPEGTRLYLKDHK